MTRVILRPGESAGMQQAAGAGARREVSAPRVYGLDEPVELDGVSYSADVLSAAEG